MAQREKIIKRALKETKVSCSRIAEADSIQKPKANTEKMQKPKANPACENRKKIQKPRCPMQENKLSCEVSCKKNSHIPGTNVPGNGVVRIYLRSVVLIYL